MKKQNKKLILGVVLTLCLCACIGLVTVWLLQRDHELDVIREEALQELVARRGEYDEKSIVLYDTNPGEAQALAERFDAELRISADGKFARLTLRGDMTVEDVYSDRDNRKYLKEMTLDYQVRVSELTDAESQEIDGERLPTRPQYSVSDTDYELQGYLDYLNMKDVWKQTRGSGVTVAVIDTGIDTDHPEFEGRISEYSYNATEDKVVKDSLLEDGSYDWSLIEDEQGHGTAVAGVIAASMNSGSVVGIAPEATILVIKAECDESGKFARTSDLVFGLYYAIEQDVAVVNMSFGGPDNLYASATQLAYDSDIICIAAAGNDGLTTPQYPAADELVFGIGALETNGWDLASYSNYGENVNLVAPGTTYTAVMGGGYGIKTGTSLASPVVAGAVALYSSFNRHRNFDFDTVQELLYASCYDLGSLGCDWYYGYGALDVSALILEERGTVTFQMMTDELENTEQIFVRNHTLQNIPEPERLYAIFDGWYYDPYFTEEYNWYADEFSADLTLYAHWVNEDDGVPFVYVKLDDGTIEIRSYTGRRSYIKIPDTIEGKPVTVIGEKAFYGQTRLREVTLPNQLKVIGRAAFEGCSNLRGIEIPDTVIKIDEKAFCNNVRLSYVAFGSNSQLKSIGSGAFEKCAQLLRMELPASLTELSGSAFAGTTNLTAFSVQAGNQKFVARGGVLFNHTGSTLIAYPAGARGDYTIPTSVRYIGSYAFSYSRMESIDLSGIEQIEKGAFANSFLKQVSIPDSVTVLGGSAFRGCAYLTSVQIGNGVQCIPGGAFSECMALSSVEISANVRCIETSAFSYTPSLESVVFAENSILTEIGKTAFGSSGLRSISIPASVISIGEAAFCNTLLSSVTFEEGSQLRIIGEEAFSGALHLIQIQLPNQLEQIDAYAFQETGLKSVEIPVGVTDLKEGVFASCHSLIQITVADGNSAYQDVNGVVYDRNMTTLVAYPAGASATAYTVADQVIAIGEAAFRGARNLTSVQLPASLQEIQREAFYGCSSIRSMQIPDNVVQISNLAFAETTKLTGIKFGKNSKLPRIGNQAFAYSGISSFSVPASVSSIAQGAFEGCTKLYSITFQENSRLTAISAYMLSGCDNLSSLTFEKGSSLTSIQAHGLEGMSRLRSISFGDAKITTIDNFAFRFCESLTSLTIPEGVTYLGRYAFYDCAALERVELPQSIAFVGEFAFLGTKPAEVYFTSETLPADLQENWDYGIEGYYLGVSEVVAEGDWEYAKLSGGAIAIIKYNGSEKHIDLTSLNLGGNIVNIGGAAFAYSTVESIALPETLTTIQAEAFYGSALQSVSIPSSVQFIGRSAFADTPLETLTFEADSSLAVIERSAFENTKRLQGVSLPASLKTLGSLAFKNSGISSLTFEEGIALTEISEEAFAYTGITSLVLPNGIKTIGESAFRETTRLKTVAFGNADDLMIMSNAFYHAGLTELHIPANVSYLGEYAFVALPNLQSYSVDESNPLYRAVDGLLLSKDGRKLIAAPAGRTGSLTVPTGVEIIGFGAFEDSRLTRIAFLDNANILSFGYRAFYASSITEMHIPASVVTIDYYAFAMCKSLTRVTFAEGNQLCGIYEGAFYGCQKLSDIVLPDTVREIAEFAFYGCGGLGELPVSQTTSLKGIYDYAFAYTGFEGVLTLPETLTDIGSYAFSGTRLHEVIVPNTNAYDLVIGIGAFGGCTELTDITLPFIGASFEDDEITWFGYIFGAGGHEANATYVPKSLKRVTLHEGISMVGEYAFDGIATLEEIHVPHSVTLVYNNAFFGTTARYELTNVITAVDRRNPTRETYTATNWHFGRGLSGELRLSDVMTGIEHSAFSYCENLVSVSVGNGVTVIDSSAFRSCTGLKQVTLGSSLTTIEFRAFEDCINLTQINIPDGVTKIGNRAFLRCENLCDVRLPNGLTTIEWSAFSECPQLKSITIPQGVTEIGEHAFGNCYNLYTVYNNSDLPLTLGSQDHGCVAQYAVRLVDKNGNQTYIDPPTGYTYVTTDDGFRFLEKDGEYQLIEYFGDEETVTLPKDILGNPYTIREMRGVSKVILPEGMTRIDDSAFRKCITLVEVVIPSSVTSIGPNAFCGCENLRSINIPDGVTTIDRYAFYGCRSLERIAIPESVISIEDSAFYDCSALARMALSKNVRTIGPSAFGGCFFTDFTIDSANEWFVARDRVIYNKEMTQIVYVLDGITEVCIPNTVLHFQAAFQGQTKLSKVTFEQGFRGDTIPSKAFEGCTSLTSVVIPDGVTVIETRAFYGCTSLNSVVIPEGITQIAGEAFCGCTSLTDIAVPKSVTMMGWHAFYQCDSLESVYICDLEAWCKIRFLGMNANPLSLGADFYLNGEPVTKVVIPDTITVIPDSLFEGALCLKEVVIPEGILEIPDSAFRDCYNLERVTLPNSLVTIDAYAFSTCKSLVSIVIPDHVTTIGEQAFRHCVNLTELSLGSGLKNIGGAAFQQCTKLTEVTLPDSVTEIGRSMFASCSGLVKVSFGDNVTVIGSNAFFECGGLSSITIPAGVTEIGSSAFSQCRNLVAIYDHSALSLTPKSRDHGEIAYYAKMIVDKDGNKSYADPSVGFELVDTEDGFRFVKENGKYQLIAYLGDEETVTLPIDVFGNPYTIRRMGGVRNLIVPEGITKIDREAFRDSTALTSVVISDSVTEIDTLAFYGCTALTRVSIGSGVTTIRRAAFEKSAYYEDPSNWVNGTLYIDNCLIKVAEDAVSFEAMPNTQVIAAEAFDGCYSLKQVTLGGNGSRALEGVTNLERLVITEMPTSHKVIGYFGLEIPMTLKTVVLSKDVRMIQNAFSNLSDLTIFVDALEEDRKWDANYPGWNNDNKVVYSDKWIIAEFYDEKGNLYSNEIFLTSQVVRQPELLLEKGEQYSNVLIGWDLDGDGLADSIPATSTMDLVAHPVFETRLTTYVLRFYAEDGTTLLAKQRLPYGSLITPPEISEKQGYVFRGWIGYAEGMTVSGDASFVLEREHIGGAHSFGEAVWMPPTCTEQGCQMYTCSVCGEWYGTDFVEATGHAYETAVIPATCFADGSIHYACRTCGDEYTEILRCEGHDYQLQRIESATCTAEGTAFYRCTVCHGEISEPIAIAAHHYQKNLVSMELLQILLESKPDIFFGYENGMPYYFACVDCGNIQTENEDGGTGSSSVDDICEHRLGEWTVIYEASCLIPETHGRVCALCHQTVEMKVLSNTLLEHAYSTEWTVDIAPTCTEAGSKSRHCSMCDDRIDATEMVALGHSFTDYKPNNDATYTRDGTQTAKCDRCALTDTQVIPGSALGLMQKFKDEMKKLSENANAQPSYEELYAVLQTYASLSEEEKANVTAEFAKLQQLIKDYNTKAQTANTEMEEATEIAFAPIVSMGFAFLAALWLLLRKKLFL